MTKLDGKGEAESVVRIEPRPLVAVLHLDAAQDAKEFLRRRLLLDARLLDEEDKRRRAAVHDRQLGRVELDVGIVDAEPAERRHQVLDGVDLRFALDQGGGEARLAHELGARGNLHHRLEIDAAEHDAGIHGGGPQRHADLAACMQADAGGADE